MRGTSLNILTVPSDRWIDIYCTAIYIVGKSTETYPVDEALEEPLGGVDPSHHLLLVLWLEERAQPGV